ncbi:MAG: pyruvate, phosphate dikinase [Firmicutes bacterium]|jgi:pyruvate,orthophosphate dikinase|nr:pyruvate, phosphate dikinase [Bacillota bacterium]MDH7496108.1 pyruvate, phosphate dikinase [Bacillota bacterium]
MAKKYVYFFGKGKAEGGKEMRNLLGGKGANIAEMTNLGIPVPPGFTITTEVCSFYYDKNKQYPPELADQVLENLRKLEDAMDLKFGDAERPLLVSVRSGARVSMPGMMDTVLNLGLNDETVKGLIKLTGNERFAYDAYRRFVQMFGNVVLGVSHDDFEEILEGKKKSLGVHLDTELDAAALKDVVRAFKARIREKKGIDFPEDPMKQLEMARDAVFGSWNNPRAITYRKIHNIPGDWGTAVNVQAMVFGNMGENSGTGVAFTRDPATGEKKYYGEYLKNAQGEDVVAGIRTPKPIAELEREMPEVYRELTGIFEKLERHYRDMQDVEFTIQEGKLFMLQTRAGKRTAAAAVKIAVDMVREGLITKEEAIMRVEPAQLDTLLHKMIDPKAKVSVLATGVAASPGAAVGAVVFTADDAAERGGAGEKVILVRKETSPDDIHGMAAAQGILTSRGGKTSHAAVVARGMGTPAVTGCEAITVVEAEKLFRVGDVVVKEGDVITLDGTNGRVILGEAPLVDPTIGGDFATLMDWADEIKSLGVRANADTPHDAETALKFGAKGIGLCRTEHMFFGEERVPVVQEMILAETTEARRAALDKLLPFQVEDFRGILKAMAGYPVIIRLLDPPLHEFLPSHEELLVEVTKMKLQGTDGEGLRKKEALLARVDKLRELNPMLGHRGCRLGITYPEINEMQARAIFEAACELVKEGYKVFPEVMIPVVGHVREIEIAREVVERVARETMEKHGVKLEYMVGTMIELPRAALTADEIAKEAQFFSFGTNDLTQTTFGFSRDDAEGKFLPYYLEHNILEHNPFEVLDRKGVGQLINIAVERGRQTRPELEVGICGEHGGDPSSVEFCHDAGLDYVSCSPFRVPIARLAAARAEIKNPRKATGKTGRVDEYTTA